MELDVYLRFLLTLGAVLGLIAALAWAARRLGLGGALVGNGGKDQRLSVLEVRALDSRRKLVLLRRDSREHLLLIGPGGDLVIETGIPFAGQEPQAPRISLPDGTRRVAR